MILYGSIITSSVWQRLYVILRFMFHSKMLEHLFIASYYGQLRLQDSKMKYFNINSSFVSLEGPEARVNKDGINLLVFIILDYK